MRLLLVEDDQQLSATLARGLREQAYAVDVAHDGEEALYQSSVSQYDAIILDILLPRLDGFQVCQRIRASGSAVRILMLTARTDTSDRVLGLDCGADDYLTKPFEFEELVARLRALLRRRGEQVDAEKVAIGDLEIDFRSHRVTRAGRAIELTTKEFTLLAYLARHVGEVISRAKLTEHVWDENHDPASNAVEVYINRLRKKLDVGGSVSLITNRRGSGYVLGSVRND